MEGGDGRYMSPELMEGSPEKLIGNLEKSDVWSLGKRNIKFVMIFLKNK